MIYRRINETKNKVAIVTEASSCMGESIVKLFTEEGSKVVAVDWPKERLSNLLGDIGETYTGSIICLEGDVSDRFRVKSNVDIHSNI